MPENCEVCLTAQYLDSKTCDSNITKIKILSGRYSHKSFNGFTEFEKILPAKIKSIDTKGKFLWFVLTSKNKEYYILNTFGLTGKWGFKPLDFARVKFTINDPTTKKKYNLYFDDVRNFGTIEFTSDKKKLEQKLNKLAPDALKSQFTDAEFKYWIYEYKNKKQMLVKVLMDQTQTKGIVSGLGNYLVPEILYRSKLSPYRTIKSLDDPEIKQLAKSIKYILRMCYIKNNTDYVSHLVTFLKSHNDKIKNGKFPDYYDDIKTVEKDFQFTVYRQKEDPEGNPVLADKIINGRTTYWVPVIQV